MRNFKKINKNNKDYGKKTKKNKIFKWKLKKNNKSILDNKPEQILGNQKKNA